MSSMREFAKIMSNQNKDKDNIKTQFDSADISAYFKFFTDEITAGDQLVVKERDTSNEMVWDRDVWDGTSGTAIDNWGTGDFTGSQDIIRVINPNRTHKDYFDDAYWNDTANTNATWTGGGQISFSGTQTASSNIVYANLETVSSAKLTAVGSGSVNYLMSADNGSNWESVTSGQSHTFTNTGTQLKWRVTATSSSSVSKVTIVY